MLSVFQKLGKKYQDRCLVQDQLSKNELLDQHHKRIDLNQPSFIFGLASFREGVDLPGDYCKHVVITRIPFDVPSDPIVKSREELLAKDGHSSYEIFLKLSVPEATLRLIQACGRLIRNENDRGRITILDRRIVDKSYGAQIIKAMPPYKQYIDN